MRIPISETDVGCWHEVLKDRATFTPSYHEWSYNYGIRHRYRTGTYAEFKELYPYRATDAYSNSRSKVRDKYYK